ncbi:hypothetical protein [Rathayibacter toxicus]|uniref:hypothetical protein n=1 Tax=Rathayibacter toxicus TaxID=145458 RepID=UPI0011B0650C|nr:hypothetical protein [Rathayibacter toxicus]QWL48549.1 hypothetical protein E2R43_02235 [Rathayibacter toxicus]QWL52945.1 hypothetical protein E2R45_02230 [Rathayibacter toxicus]
MADQRVEEEVTFGTYYVRVGSAEEFERVLPESWAALHRLGFIAEEAPLLFRSVSAPPRHIELAKWVPGVMGPAHEHPDLIPIWTRLANLVEPHTPAVVDRGLVFDEFVPEVLNAVA